MRISYKYVVYFDYIHYFFPFSFSLSVYHFSLPESCFFLIQSPHSDTVMLMGIEYRYQNIGAFAELVLLKKTDFISPRNYQLPKIFSYMWDFMSTFPSPDMIWLAFSCSGLAHVVTFSVNSMCAIVLSYPKNTVLLLISTTYSSLFFLWVVILIDDYHKTFS